MSDITKCKGTDCPQHLKENCYRFTAPSKEWLQSYFVYIPFDMAKNDCKYFWNKEKVDEDS